MYLLIYLFILLLSFPAVYSTSIVLYSVDSLDPHNLPNHMICDPVPSAFCCQPLPGWTTALVAEFFGLPLTAAAAVFQQEASMPGSSDYLSPSNSGCNGPILDSRVGTPHWRHWAAPGGPRIAGASWIDCPAARTARVGWIKGWVGNLGHFCLPQKMVGVIDRRQSIEGDTARISGYPNIISLNGTNFTDQYRGDLIYRDGQGRVLDLKTVKW